MKQFVVLADASKTTVYGPYSETRANEIGKFNGGISVPLTLSSIDTLDDTKYRAECLRDELQRWYNKTGDPCFQEAFAHLGSCLSVIDNG